MHLLLIDENASLEFYKGAMECFHQKRLGNSGHILEVRKLTTNDLGTSSLKKLREAISTKFTSVILWKEKYNFNRGLDVIEKELRDNARIQVNQAMHENVLRQALPGKPTDETIVQLQDKAVMDGYMLYVYRDNEHLEVSLNESIVENKPIRFHSLDSVTV